MLDFLVISKKKNKSGTWEIKPKFRLYPKSNDLMIRGGDFYAAWIEDLGLWSTREDDVLYEIDKQIDEYVEANRNIFGEDVHVSYMWDSDSGVIDDWHKYCQRQKRDSFEMLDEKLMFSNDAPNKTMYASKKLDYPLEAGSCPNWDKLIGTLYNEEERHKIEWAIGSIVNGDSKTLQKFMVLYGSAGTGKSTILNIIQALFDGYYTTFDAKALGSNNAQFALESFRSNPLVAIQHDGDLSRIEDNTRLNSLVSHELMTVNEKYTKGYTNRFKCFLFMGTNKPVKITDAKSGIIRRLIDVTPSGNKLKASEYKRALHGVMFELGAIAWHCKEVYEEDPDCYNEYVPTSMMGATNDFYNFVLDSYFVFKKEDGISLKAAWEMYKTYSEDAKLSYPMSQRVFKEELKNYFRSFEERFTDSEGSRIRSYYSGFLSDKFEEETKPKETVEEKTWLEFITGDSPFDDLCKDCQAQYASDRETPIKKWDDVTSTLSELDTSKLHYVKLQENHIVIDFDIPDENGNKSLEMNLKEASKWPPTYAELSKSGNGIHLHYIYQGDVSKLSRLYSDKVEIKVFTGKSSLRRKLTRFVNLAIATISSGLPIKEDKPMLSSTTLTDELHLRKMIQKNLNKEFHADTTSSINFIAKLLNEAYESGMSYDVSDMYNLILAFASQSTHQAEQCMRVVDNMQFKSKELTPSKDGDDDIPIVFFDIEVFPNLFIICWKFRGQENPVMRMINPSISDIEMLLRYRIIGFNNKRYDNHIVYDAYTGASNLELYHRSVKIISGDRSAFIGNAYNISYTDIYDFASAGNKKSLKKLEIEMGIHHQELGLPWDKPVPEELWGKVAEYCDNDVLATEAAFDYLSADWTARQILADITDSSVNDSTNQLTTKFIFGNDKKPQSQFCYRNLAEPVFELDPEVEAFLREKFPEMMAERHGEAKSILPYFPGYRFENGKSYYRGEIVGEGGWAEGFPGFWINVGLDDIMSMHPHSALAECLFGPVYSQRFYEIVYGRVSIKHEEWDEVNSMLDGKLTKYVERVKKGEMTSKQLADALKTAINSVYGLTSASFENPFRDPRNVDNIVAKRGALFMLDLKAAVIEQGYKVVHIKTDSIKVENADSEIIDFIYKFGKRYGYTFEHEATYDKMALMNDAVYIAKYADADKCKEIYGYAPGDNKKKGGRWTATGKQFAVPYLFKTLFSGEPIEFEDLCETFAVSKGELYLDLNETLTDVSAEEKEFEKLTKKLTKLDSDDPENLTINARLKELTPIIDEGHDLAFVGRVGQFCPIKDGAGGGVLYRVSDGKKYAAPGSTGYRWLESEQVKMFGKEDAIDKRFYNKLVDDAVGDISKFVDFEYFVSDEPIPIPAKLDQRPPWD